MTISLRSTTTDYTVDSTIRGIAEEHLYKICEMQYKLSPTDLVLPALSELDEMTLKAFEIPGYEDYFLRELQRSDDVGLDGLILTKAMIVDVVESTSAGSGEEEVYHPLPPPINNNGRGWS